MNAWTRSTPKSTTCNELASHSALRRAPPPPPARGAARRGRRAKAQQPKGPHSRPERRRHRRDQSHRVRAKPPAGVPDQTDRGQQRARRSCSRSNGLNMYSARPTRGSPRQPSPSRQARNIRQPSSSCATWRLLAGFAAKGHAAQHAGASSPMRTESPNALHNSSGSHGNGRRPGGTATPASAEHLASATIGVSGSVAARFAPQELCLPSGELTFPLCIPLRLRRS
jgi:hypothetical protein